MSDASARARSHPDDQQNAAFNFNGLKVDEQGGITYHGATSFFHLPNDRGTHGSDVSNSSDLDVQRRARLVTNAWHQRAMENLTEIPVGR